MKKIYFLLLTGVILSVIGYYYHNNKPDINQIQVLEYRNNVKKQKVILRGYTVRVIDGDTIEFLDSNLNTHIVRLCGIDAPEMKQKYGLISSLKLYEKLIPNNNPTNIIIEIVNKDLYGRDVGIIRYNDDELPINYMMVEEGYAWYYRKYPVPNNSIPDKLSYENSEIISIKEKRGIWKNGEDLIPPWEFRKSKTRIIE